MDLRPLKLERRENNRLAITWSDGQVRVYAANQLREACPCATCREKRAAPAPPPNPLAVLPINEARPISIQGMSPVGQYAYSIAFSDGHDTGIFTLEYLHELGDLVPEPAN